SSAHTSTKPARPRTIPCASSAAPVCSTTARSPGRSTRTRVLPKSRVIATTGSLDVTSARGAGWTDVAERAVRACQGARARRVLAGPDPGCGSRDPATCLLESRGIHVSAPDESRVEEVELDRVGKPARHRLVRHRVDL